MRPLNEPFFWAIFSAGGMVVALLLPVLIIITGFVVPAGGVEFDQLDTLFQQPARATDRVRRGVPVVLPRRAPHPPHAEGPRAALGVHAAGSGLLRCRPCRDDLGGAGRPLIWSDRLSSSTGGGRRDPAPERGEMDERGRCCDDVSL